MIDDVMGEEMLFNRDRAFLLMEEAGIDVLLLTQPNNFLYLSGFTQVNSFSFIDRPSIGLFFADPSSAPVAIIPHWNYPAFVRVSWITKVVAYAEHATDHGTDKSGGWRQAMKGVLRACPDARRIGVEEKFLAKWILDVLVDAFPDRAFVDCTELIRRIRAVKTPVEIERMRSATRILENACEDMLADARAGITETELATAFRASVGRQGGEGIKNFVLGIGPESVVTHKVPGACELRDGYVLRFDLGVQVLGYYADNARSYVWGTPNQVQSRIYTAVLEGQQRGAALLRSGVTAGEIYDATLAAVREEIPGIKMEHVGHGMGVEHHESPALIYGSRQELEPNMVINVETLYNDPEHGAFTVEDTYLITENGSERWTELPRELSLISGADRGRL